MKDSLDLVYLSSGRDIVSCLVFSYHSNSSFFSFYIRAVGQK